MVRLRGATIVVRALEDAGVRRVFGIPGAHNLELYDALARSEQVEPVLVADERSAAFLADGISRTSQEVGVLNLVPGAGVALALAGIAEAWLDNVAMVVVACAVRADTGAAFQLHAIDQLSLLRPVTKQCFRVADPGDLYPAVRRAFELARRAPAGPVAVEIPADLLLRRQAVDALEHVPNPELEVTPDRELVERAAEALGSACRPVLYLGAGAAGAADLLVPLAEQLAAPVVTTIAGKGVFPERHPLWLWSGFGAQAPRFVRRLVDRCDCMLALGCRFAEVATGSYGVRPPANLIQVDVDPAVIGSAFPVALGVVADARRFVGRLGELIEGARPSRELAEEVRDGHRRVAAGWDRERDAGRVSATALFVALERYCRDDAIFAADSGNATFLAAERLRLDRPGRFIAPVDFSCMGYATPAAIGAALANPGRDVIAIVGDGALLMTGLELVTARARRVGVLVVVLRDRRLGQIAELQRPPFNRSPCTALADYSVEALGRTAGAAYFRVVRDAELDSVLPAALELVRGGAPGLLEVEVERPFPTYFTRGVVRTNLRRLPWSERLAVLARALVRRLL